MVLNSLQFHFRENIHLKTIGMNYPANIGLSAAYGHKSALLRQCGHGLKAQTINRQDALITTCGRFNCLFYLPIRDSYSTADSFFDQAARFIIYPMMPIHCKINKLKTKILCFFKYLYFLRPGKGDTIFFILLFFFCTTYIF